MSKRSIFNFLVAWTGLTLFSLSTFAITVADVPRMTKEELRSRLSDGNTVVIDVRTSYDWDNSDSKIFGAIRENPQDVLSWAKKYPKEKILVLYCS